MTYYKSIISMTLLVLAVMLTGCSTDGYWDKAPTDSEVKYSFDQGTQTYSVSGTETFNEIKVPMTRTTTTGESTIVINAEFSHDALSGPSEVIFADGSNTAIYTISVGDIQAGVAYKASLSITKESTSIAGNSTSAISLSKTYTWSPAGSAQFYTAWSGTIKNGGLVGDGVKVNIERADGGNGLYRLMSPYYFSETETGATGVTLTQGKHIQFMVNASTGALLGFPSVVQAIGEASADDGNYYFVYTPGANNCSIANEGNTYEISALIGYDEGGSSVTPGWYETVVFIWNENYPW